MYWDDVACGLPGHLPGPPAARPTGRFREDVRPDAPFSTAIQIGATVSVRWGILSTARINGAILDGARASEEVEVVAVASRDGDVAKAYARDNGVERAHAGYDALLTDRDVDAVYISLPNSLHVPWSIRALQAGKHVLCEKPLSRRAADVEAAFDAAERAGRILMEGFMYRHHPQTRRLVELVGEGTVGRLRLVRASFSFPLGDRHDVRLSRALDGGALMGVGCYCVSAARLLAGEPARVLGERVEGGDGVDVAFAATLHFADDVLALFDAGVAYARRDELEVVGDEASLFLGDPWHCRTPVIEARRPSGIERVAVDRADSYRLQLENLSRAIRGAAEPLLGRDDAVGQARTIEALYRSAQEGRSVTVGTTTSAAE